MTLKQLSGYQVTNGVNKAPITQNFKYQKKKKKIQQIFQKLNTFSTQIPRLSSN